MMDRLFLFVVALCASCTHGCSTEKDSDSRCESFALQGLCSESRVFESCRFSCCVSTSSTISSTSLSTTTTRTTTTRTMTTKTTMTSTTATSTMTTECGRDEFYCSYDNLCIDIEWVRDGIQDCADGEDELATTTTQPSPQPTASPTFAPTTTITSTTMSFTSITVTISTTTPSSTTSSLTSTVATSTVSTSRSVVEEGPTITSSSSIAVLTTTTSHTPTVTTHSTLSSTDATSTSKLTATTPVAKTTIVTSTVPTELSKASKSTAHVVDFETTLIIVIGGAIVVLSCAWCIGSCLGRRCVSGSYSTQSTAISHNAAYDATVGMARQSTTLVTSNDNQKSSSFVLEVAPPLSLYHNRVDEEDMMSKTVRRPTNTSLHLVNEELLGETVVRNEEVLGETVVNNEPVIQPTTSPLTSTANANSRNTTKDSDVTHVQGNTNKASYTDVNSDVRAACTPNNMDKRNRLDEEREPEVNNRTNVEATTVIASERRRDVVNKEDEVEEPVHDVVPSQIQSAELKSTPPPPPTTVPTTTTTNSSSTPPTPTPTPTPLTKKQPQEKTNQVTTSAVVVESSPPPPRPAPTDIATPKTTPPTSTPSPPSWLHGVIDKQAAATLVSQTLGSDGEVNPGTFLVRKLHETAETEYALCVWFKGRPTHHKMAKDETTGVWMVNNKAWGGKTDFVEAVEQFYGVVQGWPVKFSTAVTCTSGGASAAIEIPRSSSQSKPKPNTTAPTPTPSPPSWLHGVIDKQAAATLVSQTLGSDGEVNPGTFLVRKLHETAETEYALCVWFKGRPTHHKMAKDETTGVWMVNNKAWGGKTDFVEAVEQFYGVVQGWPVKFSTAVPCTSSGDSSSLEELIIQPSDTSKARVDELLQSHQPTKEGRFVVFKSASMEYAMGIWFKGKSTFHAVHRDEETGDLTVNKKRLGDARTLDQLISLLSNKTLPKSWPVRLCEAVTADAKLYSL